MNDLQTDPSVARYHASRALRVALAGSFVAGAVLIAQGTLAAARDLVGPDDFEYVGAFRLPDGGERPTTFDYSGNAMTYHPHGDPGGAGDGFPGSLILTGHERIAYGDVPDGNQLAEISIPKPVKSKSLDALPRSEMRRGFTNTLAGWFTNMEELPRIGLAYLDRPETGPLLHLGWGQHFEPEEATPTHVWFDLDFNPASVRGGWFIGAESFYSVNGYLFEIPQSWADRHTGGRALATGRFRDGGWSGMGPSLFAYQPWTDTDGSPAPEGSRLETVTLLRYRSTIETSDIEGTLAEYQHPDEWEGGAWLTTAAGKSAVLFAGTKATGRKYWYGFTNPEGEELPCTFAGVAGDFVGCRHADGRPCPERDLIECRNHDEARGWWSAEFQAQFILYDPEDLARVSSGAMEPHEPQPYAQLRIDNVLRLELEPGTVDWAGAGSQRRQRIGAVAYDRANQLLYVLEQYGDGAKPLVHVWRIG